MSDTPFTHNTTPDQNNSHMQQHLRTLCPLPIGVVVCQDTHDTLDDLRRHFRTVHTHGFEALKQIMLQGDLPLDEHEVTIAALEEGLIPWYYGRGGWAPLTPELLHQLAIDPSLSPAEIQNHPSMLSYQSEFLKQRARRLAQKPPAAPGVLMGEPHRNGGALPTHLIPAFALWLQQTYGTLEQALQTYHLAAHTIGREKTLLDSFTALAALAQIERIGHPQGQGWSGVRQKRDILRFIADYTCEQIRHVADQSLAWDPHEPVRTGVHMTLENQAVNGWDFELQARSIAHAGSFYSSFHPTHHLAEVDGELERPCYMIARIVADMNKGGWSAMWESVGGPQTYSGQYSYTFDGHTMERCLLSYLAAGLKGVGIWCWNSRDRGWEVGEYGLCDLTGKPSSRAQAAGAIARACEKYRFELWQAHDQPQVGILYSWENDAAFARLSYGGYPLERLKEYPHLPARARIGSMRALINHCIPFELVTERNLKEGLASRYSTIYVPHTICLEHEIVRILLDYVKQGGRVVIDTPSLLLQAEDGTRYNTSQGSDFEQLCGLELANVQSTFNYPLTFKGHPLSGFFTDVTITTAQSLAQFSDGRPAILEHHVGKGSVAFIAFEISSLCHKPGQSALEREITDLLLNGKQPPYHVDQPILAYRRVAPKADHFFLINDQPHHHTVTLTVPNQCYSNATDCVTNETLPINAHTLHLTLEPWQGRWLRLAHTPENSHA